VSDLLTRVFNVLRHHQVKLEPNFTSVIISIMVLEGLGRTLDPDMDLLWAAAPFLLT
jgi:aarF domain-containing kinase